jgi:DNA-binding MarR family transcriptional regulator
MISSFDLEIQNNQIEHRIIAGLERIAEVFRILLWNQGKKFRLSPIQIQILIFLNTHNQDKCNVSYLAKEFNLTKATVSDAIQSLLRKGYITKRQSQSDARSYGIELTRSGKLLYQKISNYSDKLIEPIFRLSQNEKECLLENLINIIYQLNQSGVISIQRMCFTCKYYKNEDKKHFCQFLGKPLSKNELRLDCPDYDAL